MGASVTLRWMKDGELRQGDLASLDVARASGGPLWVDVLAPDRPALEALAGPFGLHPLAIEDCLHDDQRPKLEAYTGNLFFVWRLPTEVRGDELRATELDVFLGHGWIITSHAEKLVPIDEVVADSTCGLDRGPEWLLHEVLERGVDEVFPIVDRVGEELDEIGDVLLDRPDRTALPRLHRLKRLLLAAHKVLGPERDALRELAREQEFVSAEAYRYFQDVGDHLARLEDRVDTYRDVASSVMDVYLSAVNNQLNVVMKRLTVVATIFMPGTLVASIFGMNIGFPFRDTYTGFGLALALIGAASIGMYVAFKRSDLW